MHVERIETAERFRDLRAAWNDLLSASSADGVFLTWEWLYTWWKHFGAAHDRTLAVLAVREGTELVALAPFYMRRARVVGVEFASLEFLGTGLVGSDYLDVIVRPDRRADALAAMAEHLASGGVRLDLVQVARGRADALGLTRALAGHGWRAVERTTHVCPFIRLAGHSWTSYLGALGPEHRANVRRRLRQVSEKFRLTFECAAGPDERRVALRHLIRLHRERWRDRGVSEAFDEASVAFHDEVTELARERGWLRLYVMTLDGVAAASLYGFQYGRVFSFYQSGFDPEFARWSVGLCTMALAIERAVADGAEEYDFLHGDESYKFLWARDTRELSRIELYPCSPRNLTVAGARSVRRAAKWLVRSTTTTGVVSQVREAAGLVMKGLA